MQRQRHPGTYQGSCCSPCCCCCRATDGAYKLQLSVINHPPARQGEARQGNARQGEPRRVSTSLVVCLCPGSPSSLLSFCLPLGNLLAQPRSRHQHGCRHRCTRRDMRSSRIVVLLPDHVAGHGTLLVNHTAT